MPTRRHLANRQYLQLVRFVDTISQFSPFVHMNFLCSCSLSIRRKKPCIDMKSILLVPQQHHSNHVVDSWTYITLHHDTIMATDPCPDTVQAVSARPLGTEWSSTELCCWAATASDHICKRGNKCIHIYAVIKQLKGNNGHPSDARNWAQCPWLGNELWLTAISFGTQQNVFLTDQGNISALSTCHMLSVCNYMYCRYISKWNELVLVWGMT